VHDLSSAALLYTHNYGLYFVAGQAVWFLRESRRRYRVDARRVFIVSSLLSLGTIGLLYLPWLPTLRWQIGQVSAHYWIPPLQWQDVGTLVCQFFSGPADGTCQLSWYEAFLCLAGTLLGIWPWRAMPAE